MWYSRGTCGAVGVVTLVSIQLGCGSRESLKQDSWIVAVSKGCTIETVFVKTVDKATKSDQHVIEKGCDVAKAQCLGELAKRAAAKANRKCKSGRKFTNEGKFCSAVRGNFDEETNVEYGKCNKDTNTNITTVECSFKGKVKYVCDG